jgi:nitroimidazol reductase NimA-like FMN-containing flavoprotein (pyridoxamine 5'-phosphate oxidase superfamily)
MELLLNHAVGRLAVTTVDGPYIVALNYIFLEGSIYFHSGQAGRKIEALRADSRVCFLVDDVGPQILHEQGCGISQIYESVICFGKTEFVEGPVEKRRILERMVRSVHKYPFYSEGSKYREDPGDWIESISGKRISSSSHGSTHHCQVRNRLARPKRHIWLAYAGAQDVFSDAILKLVRCLK